MIKAQQTAIESASGQKLEVTTKNSALGVKDLVAGKANLAVVSGPAKAVYKAAGISDDVADKLVAATVGSEKAAFIVNPANPVSTLTTDQLKGIFTGKITNWKEVGGSDTPIRVFFADQSNGFRLAADEQLFGGAALVGTERAKSGDVTPVVAQSPDAISFIGAGDVKATVKVVEQSAVTIPLILVSNGQPTADQKAVISATTAIFTK
jgi:phosphate transport system substrate-binding protein